MHGNAQAYVRLPPNLIHFTQNSCVCLAIFVQNWIPERTSERAYSKQHKSELQNADYTGKSCTEREACTVLKEID